MKVLSLGIFVVCNLLLGSHADENAKDPLVIIIRSQPNEFHYQVAMETKTDLEGQISELGVGVKVVLLHEQWPVEQAWIITPITPVIMRQYCDNYRWVMFIEESTKVDMKKLVEEVLVRYDSSEKHFLGRCLTDKTPCIIHHFAFFEGGIKDFNYPDFDAGWLMSSALLMQVGMDYDQGKQKVDFQIDIKHEIAMFLDKTYGVKLTCVNELCGANKTSVCATSFDPKIRDCKPLLSNSDLFFAVKTTKKFHKDRVQVVKKTWGQYAENIIYFSNVTDPSVPTMDCGVPNTESGHCGKMESIINYARDKMKTSPWLVITDDDTILGVSKMVRLLSCYNTEDIVLLGERYSYGLNVDDGYGYITGGGSMVLSRGAIDAWFSNRCGCPKIDTPDDMYLGHCFKTHVGVMATHSPKFHQARPDDYSQGYLDNHEPVSFHKHWETDPYKVYAKYFAGEDEEKYGGQNPTAPPVTTPTPAPDHGPVPIPPTPTENQIKDEL